MRRHPLDGLVVHFNGGEVVGVVGVEAAQVEQGRDLGGFVRARVLETGTVQLRAAPVHLDGRLFLTEQRVHQTQIQMRHCVHMQQNRNTMNHHTRINITRTPRIPNQRSIKTYWPCEGGNGWPICTTGWPRRSASALGIKFL